ncbi:class I SAM-dependent methyltransferase [Lusitaniella coriacea LEGE 07157]|uniref:Class I SAM-dependent methyltransferase n=1 Tax=Lusitaniella coriacea LEGE 07157 TaxID=945747 RepID=A0A8J7DZ69_9CYAN|nr:class I SAM-dependent methyltransferase [Lusitaniella coriacea]MBE9118017.1 class I SAM-dependent methyltransferase [Lusitaniella coriacea LEGE 07157]
MNKSEDFWNKASKNYDKTEERFEYIHKKARENTKKHLKDSHIVMDYGCGTGTASCEFSSQVKEIQGIDISSEMIRIAKEKAVVSKIKNVNFEKADLFEDKFQNESFDVILTFNMLHTVPNPQNIVHRINDLLKPDGLFISITPCLGQKMSILVNLQIQLVRILCKFGVIPIPIRRIKNSDIDILLATGEFEAIESEEIFKGASSYFVAAKKLHKT